MLGGTCWVVNLWLSVARCKFPQWSRQNEVGILIGNESKEPVQTFELLGLHVDLYDLKLNASLIQPGLGREQRFLVSAFNLKKTKQSVCLSGSPIISIC